MSKTFEQKYELRAMHRPFRFPSYSLLLLFAPLSFKRSHRGLAVKFYGGTLHLEFPLIRRCDVCTQKQASLGSEEVKLAREKRSAKRRTITSLTC